MRLSLATLYTLGECGDLAAIDAWHEWIRLAAFNAEEYCVQTHYYNGKYETKLQWEFKLQLRKN